MTIFYISDAHFFHQNIISFCKRPYTSVAEMNAALVANWNSKVTDEDTVYFLGDFALGKFTDEEIKAIFDSLNGKKHLIYGNHDHGNIKKLPWESQQDILTVKDSGFRIVLFHYPMRSWNGSFHGSYHFFGHTHGTIPDLDMAVDVGVDNWNMFPVTFAEVNAKIILARKAREEAELALLVSITE